MGAWVKDLYGPRMNALHYMVSESIAEGAIVMREDTATEPGEVENADAATAALNCLGCAEDSATYSATQGDPLGEVLLCPQPFAVYEFLVSGGATAGTALVSGATPAHILTAEEADTDGTEIHDVKVGTLVFEGGLVKGRTGANGGIIRKISNEVNNDLCGVTAPFPNDIAAGDTFIRLPYSRAAIAMQSTTDFKQADGIIAFGTGIPVMVTGVTIDELNDRAKVRVVFRTHLFNSLA